VEISLNLSAAPGFEAFLSEASQSCMKKLKRMLLTWVMSERLLLVCRLQLGVSGRRVNLEGSVARILILKDSKHTPKAS
jgi:hypothetical protein